MWHCHMLEHEDYDMMRAYSVRPESGDDGSATE
jgi:FtsP/CotA-like multicopper oxidase with cupredoxin domain